MGMAILPGRLDKELDEIRKILCGEMDHDINQTPWNRNYMLYKHKHWISELVSKYGNRVTADRADAIVKAEVGNRFLEVLLDASVFKRDAPGRAAFQRFIQSCGFVQTHTAVAVSYTHLTHIAWGGKESQRNSSSPTNQLSTSSLQAAA